MTPDAIHKLVTQSFPNLLAERCENPDGWSYFLGTKKGGAGSNSALRAVANKPNQNASLKLSISARLYKIKDQVFCGSEGQLIDLINNEISLYKKHFE